MTQVSAPIVEIGTFLENDDIRRVTEVLRLERSEGMLQQYYGKDRFLPHLSAKTKEEVLLQLCDIIRAQEDVDDDFYELVLERESYVQLDCGNRIALPHPNRIASEQSLPMLPCSMSR